MGVVAGWELDGGVVELVFIHELEGFGIEQI